MTQPTNLDKLKKAAREKYIQMWAQQEVPALNEQAAILDEIVTSTYLQAVERPDDLLDDMWGVICNVSGEQSQEWTDAMYRIREKYFKYMSDTQSLKQTKDED